jgi:hypothetical protein
LLSRQLGDRVVQNRARLLLEDDLWRAAQIARSS